MDSASLYSTRIKKTFDDDLADILALFRTKIAAKAVPKLTLINYHQGLPISYPATAIAVEHGCLDLDIAPQQAVVIATDNHTILRSDLFDHDILAHVQYVNIRRHAVTLNKLCFVEIMAEKRAAVRIDITPPICSTLHFQGMTLAGRLGNISAHGMAIAIDEYVEIENGSEITVSFQLPDPGLGRQTPLTLTASLIGIGGEASPYLCKLRIFPDKQQEQVISRFIFQRQVEIIKDIKNGL